MFSKSIAICQQEPSGRAENIWQIKSNGSVKAYT